jgi:hypothetical protein
MDLGVADRKRENKRQVFVNAGRSTTGDVLADDDTAWPRGHRRNAGTQRVSTTLRLRSSRVSRLLHMGRISTSIPLWSYASDV